ncbi:hypothetical protein [Leptospira sp. 'Mane']|uniref:hypothetical protein n=1 Tax=Leptospira sp. 'Mane' TaxID=3387407 RepID=UPI00398BB2B1
MNPEEIPKWKYFIPFYGIYITYKSSEPSKGKWWAVSIIMTLIAISVIGGRDKKEKNIPQSAGNNDIIENSDADKSSKPQTSIGQPDQIQFHRNLKELKSKYNNAETEMAKSAVYREFASFVRKYLPGMTIKDWEGKIDTIRTDEGGEKVYLSIESEFEDFEITVETHNNSLSDYSAGSMIKLNTPVYKQLESLKEGDNVVFSGRFVSDSKRGIEQSSILESSIVTSPEFIIRFGSIAKK